MVLGARGHGTRTIIRIIYMQGAGDVSIVRGSKKVYIIR